MGENKRKHLEFIQNIIERMSRNSFFLKSLSITLAIGIFTLTERSSELATLPAILFWFLDGYFLYQERLFRNLYKEVSQKKEEQINYSMDITPFKKKIKWIKAIFSLTLIIFYTSIIITALSF